MSLRRTFPCLIGALLLLAGCLNDSAEPAIDVNLTPPPGTAISAPTETPQPEVTATATLAPWLATLQEPGPPALVADALFFRNGPDAWFVDSDLVARQVTEQRRVSAGATVPGSSSAALLLLDSAGGRETEEIRIVDTDGNESEPIYGPEIVADPGGNPRVRMMRWSPDGQRLAIVRDDDSIWLTGPDATAEEFDLLQPPSGIESIHWSPTSEAIVLLHRLANNAGGLRIVPIDGDGAFDVPPLGSFAAICWPAGQGALIVSEDSAAGRNPSAGSIFSIVLDGMDRELLISAGEFGPAVRIGALEPSPDGTKLAFTVERPSATGEFQFQALYLLDLASGARRRLEVTPKHEVSDLWWFERGLAWRAIGGRGGGRYSGVEEFTLQLFETESEETLLIYTASGM